MAFRVFVARVVMLDSKNIRYPTCAQQVKKRGDDSICMQGIRQSHGGLYLKIKAIQ